MIRIERKLAVLLVACTALALAGRAWGYDVLYTISDLGTLGGPTSVPTAISQNGIVVGNSMPNATTNHPFIYQGNAPMQDIGLLDPVNGIVGSANSVNSNGQVVGYSDAPDGNSHAFYWSGSGPPIDLGTLGGQNSTASGINANGQISGQAQDASGVPHAVVWTVGGGVTDLGTNFVANVINDEGIIGGRSWLTGNAAYYNLSTGAMTDLGAVTGGTAGYVEGISEKNGYLVGFASGAVQGAPNGDSFLYDINTGVLTNLLNPLNPLWSINALGVNDLAGVVGGYSVGASDLDGAAAFVYTATTGMQNLNDLINPSSGWSLECATAVNDEGQIVGQGVNPQGEYDAFLLTPVPEPSTFLLAAVAAIAFFAFACATRRARRRCGDRPRATDPLRHAAEHSGADRPRESEARRPRRRELALPAAMLAVLSGEAEERNTKRLSRRALALRSRPLGASERRGWIRSLSRHETARHRMVGRYRLLRAECLESRTMLAVALTYAPTAQYSGWINLQNVTDWFNQSTRQPQAWANGDEADIPASYAGTIEFADYSVGATQPIYASKIVIEGGTVDFTPEASNDVLEISHTTGVSGTTVNVAANAAAIFGMTVTSDSTGGDFSETGPGTVTIAANTTANLNNVYVGNASGDNSTLNVLGTLNVAANDTLTVAYNTALTSTTSTGAAGNGTINLGTGASLVYQSSQSSTFAGTVSGAGSVEVTSGTLWLSGSNSFLGGSFLASGTLGIGSDQALGEVPASAATNLTFTGDATLETDSSFALSPTRNIYLDAGVVATFETLGSTTYTRIPGVIGPNGGILKSGTGSLELDGINTYTDSSEIGTGVVVCGSNFALGGYEDLGNGLFGDSGVPLYIDPNGTLDVNGQDAIVTYGTIGSGGVTRTGVQVGNLYGSGNVTDNSPGGGYVDVDLSDSGNFTGTFSGSFVLGAHGQLPSVSIDVGGLASANANTLTLDGPVLDFATFEEQDNTVLGTIVVDTPAMPDYAAPQMYVHYFLNHSYSIYGNVAEFDWDSSQSCVVSSDLLPGESQPSLPVAAGATFNDVYWNSGQLEILDAPLTVESSFAQGNSTVAISNDSPGSNVGLVVEGTYSLSGGSLTVSNASMTVYAYGDLEVWYSSSVQVGASPVNVDRGGTLNVDAGSQFTVTDNSAVNFGVGGSAIGAAAVSVADSSDMAIEGSGAVNLGICTFSLTYYGVLATARSIVETATNPGNGTLAFEGGTLQATGDNSQWLAANAALVVDVTEATINTGGYDVTISSPLTGGGSLYKDGTGTLRVTGADTLTYTEIVAGTLEVDGMLAGSVDVDGPSQAPQGGTLAGIGACSGFVDVQSGGILSLGAETGPATLTIGTLTLETGALLDDEVSSQDTYVADVTGELTVNAGIDLTVDGDSVFVPYQVLFQYGSITADSFDNLDYYSIDYWNIAATPRLIDNTPASSFDLLLAGTPLYFAPNMGSSGNPGGGGPWDASTTDTDWATTPDPTTATLTSWPETGQTTYIAIFENLGTATGLTDTVTLGDGFQAEPAAMLFLGGDNYALTTGSANTGTLAIAPDATVTVAPSITATVDVSISGGQLLAYLPGGTLELDGSNSQSGTTVDGGTLAVESNAALGNPGFPLTFNGAGTLQALASMTLATSGHNRAIVTPDDPTQALTIDTYDGCSVSVPGAVSGQAGLDLVNSGSGSGVVTLSNADNTFGGVTTVGQNEQLALGNALALQDTTFDNSGGGLLSFGSLTAATFGGLQGTGSLTLENAASAAVALTVGGNGEPTVFSGSLTGSGSLTKTGNATLDLSGADLTGLSGSLVLAGGFVAAAGAGNLGGSNSALVFNGGGLQATQSFVISAGKEIDVRFGGATFDTNGNTLEINAAIGSANSGGAAGGVTVIDSSNGSGTLIVSGDNIYQGGTDLEAGDLQLNNQNALGASSGGLTVNGGVLDCNGLGPLTVGFLSGGGGLITNNAAALSTTMIVVDQSVDSMFGGNIQDGVQGGKVGLNMAGSGTLVLLGDNTYSAGTTVSNGTFVITNYTAQPDTALTVGAGATYIYDPSQGSAQPVQENAPPPGNAAGGLDGAGDGSGNAGGTPAPLPDIPPVLSSISCGYLGRDNQEVFAPSLVDATSVTFGVCFNKSVVGVSSDDFGLIGDAAAGAEVSAVSGSGCDYWVTVSGISGSGSLGLDVLPGNSITDDAGTPLAMTTFTRDQQYTICHVLYWVPAAGAAALGSGTWDTGQCWRVGSSTGPLQAWYDGSDVVFTGTPENIAIANAVTVSSITVLTDGWTFSGAPIELSGTTGQVNVAAGTTTILCGVTGDLLKSGDGWLVLGGGITSCSSISVGAGILDLGGTTAAVNTVTLTGGSIVGGVLNVADTLQLYRGTVSADITGTATLDKLGPDTVVLEGTNTYSGGTNATAGTLIAASQSSLSGAVSGTGILIVQPTLYGYGTGDWTSCTWTLADGTATGWIDGANVVIEAGADLSLSTSVNVSALTIQGNATIEGNGTLVLPAGGTTIDVLAGTATFDMGLAGGTPVKTGQGTADFLAPLATPVLVAGGQALGPGTVFSGNESLAALNPAMFGLVQSLFIVDQTIDREDMIQILQSADIGGAVTPTALAALEMLTTPQNEAVLAMPNYVAVLASDVVQGNAANANYQGQPLGNLAAQPDDATRATALTDLVDKWFYGTDLPAIPVGLTYGAVAGPLYGNNPDPAMQIPSSSDDEQGCIGDCYLISALGR